jgi:hypothetical protein
LVLPGAVCRHCSERAAPKCAHLLVDGRELRVSRERHYIDVNDVVVTEAGAAVIGGLPRLTYHETLALVGALLFAAQPSDQDAAAIARALTGAAA